MGVFGNRKIPRLLRIVHVAMILNFLFNIVYGGFQVFVVLKPEGVSGPLWTAAKDLPFELLASRRLYAIEVWICFAALATYLAVTEYLPRLLRPKADGAA